MNLAAANLVDAVLFVDDAEPNIIGARAAGLHALLHTSPSWTRATLATLVPALPAITREAFARTPTHP